MKIFEHPPLGTATLFVFTCQPHLLILLFQILRVLSMGMMCLVCCTLYLAGRNKMLSIYEVVFQPLLFKNVEVTKDNLNLLEQHSVIQSHLSIDDGLYDI